MIEGAEQIDLASAVEGLGVELHRRGNRYVGLCPFHDEKSPSFTVFSDNRFKCFGCGEYGDAMDFIQKYHNCDFKSALRILGISPGEPLTPSQKKAQRQRREVRALKKAFERWESEAADQVATILRASRNLVGTIRSEEDLENLWHLYHEIPTLEHYLEILISGDDRMKFKLFEENLYG